MLEGFRILGMNVHNGNLDHFYVIATSQSAFGVFLSTYFLRKRWFNVETEKQLLRLSAVLLLKMSK